VEVDGWSEGVLMARKRENGGSIKVFKGETLYCAKCRTPLMRQRQKDSDLMFMFHMTNDCEFSGRKFEAPTEELVEIK
jgi:hypothetical protein